MDRGGLSLLPTGAREATLVRLSQRAMATGWEIVLPAATPDPVSIGRDLFSLLDRLEEQLTVYRDGSEVSRLNRLAPARPVRVEARLFALLRQAQQIRAATEGAFDPAAGVLAKAWGFFKGPRRVPAPEEIRAALARTGWEHVRLDEARQSVRFARPVELNLGSIGKGHALDRMAERLATRWKIGTVLLHGGASSVYAKGCPHGTGRGWAVDIRHPWTPGRVLARVHLDGRALGTSAATFQHLEHQGRKLGHVLDPRSGWPAEGIASASVLAPSAAEADALSTAFFVGGIELAERYCREHPGIGAVILPDGADSPLWLGDVAGT